MSATDAPAPIVVDACWNRIGVRGDGSCPELERHVHCRNCPVFGAAANALLDRGVPDGYIAEWTRQFAAPAKVEETGTTSVVVFRIGDEWLALPTAVFEEVAELRTIHSLPTLRNSTVLGLVNVRGELLVCVSVGRMLGVRERAPAKHEERRVHHRLLVIRHESARAVFPADEVQGIHRYHPRELAPPPATVAHASATYVRGVMPWQGKSVGLLDDQLLCYALNRSLSSPTPI